MTFRNCVINGENEGVITKEQSAKALDTYEQLKLQYKETLPEQTAEAQAAKDTFDALKNEAAHKRRITLKQAQAWKRIKKNIDEFAGDPGKAAQAIIAAHDGRARFANLEKRTQTISRQAFQRMDNILGTFRRGLTGAKSTAKQPNMVREIFGDDTGDIAAKEMADAWKQTADFLRKIANNLGMRIANRTDWGLPQSHHTLNIRKAGKQAWIDEITPMLNTNKMIDEMTGKPFSREKLSLVLNDVWETIATDGANKVKDGASRFGSKSLVNRRQDHRFLVFKDAESWMKYQDKFGEPDVFKTMVNHIESMAQDIGELEILGPNPAAMRTAIKGYVTKQAKILDSKGGKQNATDKAKKDLANFDNLYSIHSRRNNQAVDGTVSNILAGARHVLQSAQLGAAPLSAITDFQTQRLAARMSGIPQVKLLGRLLKQLTPLNIEEKGRLAVRLGLGADNWTNTAISASRFFGDVTGPEVTRRISDFTMRLSGLSPMTQAGRQAFGLEYLGHMGDNIGKTFDEIDPVMKKSLSSYGIGKSDWDIIRETPLYKGFVDTLAIQNRTDLAPGRVRDVSTKLMDAILTETESAVPSSSYRARNFLIADTRPGTVPGELIKSFAMYKNYSATVLHTHIMRYFRMDGTATKASFFADYFIGTTLMGGLAIQLKEMARGKDPRPMTDAKFWGAATLQGGGLGIFGDYLSSSTSRFGNDLATTASGPVVGLVGDIGRLAFQPDNIGQNSIKFLSRYTPGSSTWYSRLAFERLVLDRLMEMSNSKHRSYFRRKERNARKNYGNQYWWKPGKNVPSRPPNISNIVSER
jgi:hypothetical protein